MANNEIVINVDDSQLNIAIEKANQLKNLLLEIKELISSLNGTLSS
jgi:hypothetical protein